MRAWSGFCAAVLVPLDVDWKIVQARSQDLQTRHTHITSDMDVRGPKRSHRMPNHSCVLWKQVSGEQGCWYEPSHSHELPDRWSGETEGSARRSQGYGIFSQPLQGLWFYRQQALRSNIRKQPQTLVEAVFTRTGKSYCFRLKKLKPACLQRRDKSLLLCVAAMKWVLEGSPRASMECTAQGEGSCPKICVSVLASEVTSQHLLFCSSPVCVSS